MNWLFLLQNSFDYEVTVSIFRECNFKTSHLLLMFWKLVVLLVLEISGNFLNNNPGEIHFLKIAANLTQTNPFNVTFQDFCLCLFI